MSTVSKRQETLVSIDSAIREVFNELFQVSEVQEDDSMETIDLWDSMGHMLLMLAIEKRFNTRIDNEDIINLTSVKTLKEYLRQRL